MNVRSVLSKITGKKLLIAEDNEDNTAILKLFLKDLDISVHFVTDGKMAVDIFKNEGADLILMDVRMPVMDGYTATRMIRQFEEENGITDYVNIVALSANAGDTDVALSLGAGCDAHVAKPIRKAKLMEILSTFLG